MKKYFCCLFLFVITLFFSQKSKVELQAENKRLQTEIASLNKQLSGNQSKKISIEKRIQLSEQKIQTRKTLVQTIDKEYQLAKNNELSIDNKILTLQNDIKSIKKNYKRVLQQTYKKRLSTNSFYFILSASSFSNMYKRYQYLKQYSKVRQEQLNRIKNKEIALNHSLNEIKKVKNEKLHLLTSQQKEKTILENEKNELKGLHTKIENENTYLIAQIQQKEKQQQIIQQQIENVIRAEIEKARIAEINRQAKLKKETKEKEKPKNKTTATTTTKTTTKTTPKTSIKTKNTNIQQEKSTTTSTTHEPEALTSSKFAKQKGQLPWPTQGKVIQGFGKQNYPGLSNVYVNNAGIDISTSKNAQAKAVFDGTVTAIISIPGGNYAIVVKHDNYFSVYNNIRELYVSKGQEVKINQPLGVIYTDNQSDKTILNFQIWQGTTKLNPSSWLR